MSISENIVRKLRESRLLQERKDYNSYTIPELVAMAKSGDQFAFENLVKQYTGVIKNMSSTYIMDTQDSEDIEQLITIVFWEAVDSWVGETEKEFTRYFSMLVQRRMAEELRKDSSEKTKLNTKADYLDTPVASDDEGGEATLGSTIPSKSLSPEEEYLGVAGARELMNYIRDKLSQKERDVILLYIKGYKVGDIMEETGMSYKSIDNTLNRVKGKIAEYLRRRQNESKRVKEGSSIDFSPEEKRILESVVKKANRQVRLKEHLAKRKKGLNKSLREARAARRDNESVRRDKATLKDHFE